MNRSNTDQRFLSKWFLIALGWTFYGLFFASQSLAGQAFFGRQVRFGGTIARWLLCALLWLFVTPLVLLLARKFPLDRQRWPKSFVVHLIVSLGLSVVLLFIYTAIILLVFGRGQSSFTAGFRDLLVGSMHAEFLTYWMIVGLTWAFDYYRKYQERELRTSQLETKLAQAQLDALRMQLQPHFLFNTLNSISVLMADDVGAARRMLTRLSELLRGSLANGGTHEVSLKEELEFLQNYIDIEQTRFQDRLTIQLEIQPAVLDARVPNLILQPLVENAIRHGISPRAHDAVIGISATRENGMVQLRVVDNGVGCGTDLERILARGIGLSNTKERLNQLYGAEHRFEIVTAAGKGFAVTIVIPWRNGEQQK
jgi:two-component system, LytTR family, sensor kinase